MKKSKILTLILAVVMIMSTMGIVAFAETEVEWPGSEKITVPEGMTNAQFAQTYECPHYEWEKEAEGVYIGGIKVAESGYYTYTSSGVISTYGTLVPASENDYNVYVDIDNKAITLNNLNVNMECGQLGWIDKAYTSYYPTRQHLITDGKTGVPGVLVITEGTYRKAGSGAGAYNWESTYYMAHGYNSDYEFAAIGVAIMDEENEWTLSLQGENSINVYSEFGMPYQNIDGNGQDQDAGVYGIFAKGALKVRGEGTININAESNWGNDGVHYHLYSASASGLWARGNLTIESGSITAKSATNDALNPMLENISFTKPNPLAAIGSSNVVTIEDGNVTATDTTDFGAGIRGIAGVVIEDGTVNASNESDYAGCGIFSGQNAAAWPGTGVYSASGGSVEITGGDVTATAEASEELLAYINENMENTGDATEAFPGSGISVGSKGSGIVISDGTVKATGTGAGISANSSSIVVSGGDVTATAKETSYAGNGAIVAERSTVSLSAGTYNTTLPDSFIAEDSAIVDGTVMTEEAAISTEWVARLGDGTYYTGADAADKAIAAANVDKYATENNTVWLTTSSSASRSGLKLGDTLTIYVAEGAEYTGTLSGEKLICDVKVGEPVTIGGTATLGEGTTTGITFTPYTYTMVVDPEYANIKVVREGAEDQYFFEFGNDYETYTACYYMQHGDTVVLLNDIDLGDSSQTIRDFVTFDFNGHTITSNSNYYVLYISSSETGTITFTDTSNLKSGGVVNTGNGSSISNSFAKVTLIIEDGTYETASASKPVVKTKVGTIMGGTFKGAVEGFTIAGGNFYTEPDSSLLADGYTWGKVSDDMYKVVRPLTIAFNPSEDENGDEIEGSWDIVLKGEAYENGDYAVNEFVSAELVFDNSKSKVEGGYNNEKMHYDVYGIDGKTSAGLNFGSSLNNASNNIQVYRINTIDGVDKINLSGNEVTIGRVQFAGKGTPVLEVLEGSRVVLTEKETYDEAIYTANGKDTDTLLLGEGITDVNLTTTKRNVRVNINFEHDMDNIENEDANLAYRNIKVTLKDSIGSPAITKDVTMEDINNGYVEFKGDEAVTVGLITVTLKAPGFRTYTYQTTMEDVTDDFVLNFWNGVLRDKTSFIEEGQARSEMKHNFLVGDIAMDYIIDKYDLAAVTSYYGNYDIKTGDTYVKYDLNRDHQIDILDVAYVLHGMGN